MLAQAAALQALLLGIYGRNAITSTQVFPKVAGYDMPDANQWQAGKSRQIEYVVRRGRRCTLLQQEACFMSPRARADAAVASCGCKGLPQPGRMSFETAFS